MESLDIVLIDNGTIPHAINILPLASNWQQWSVGDRILVINLQLAYLGDEHLNILDRLYKNREIVFWSCGTYNSNTYNH